jgi:hypothetical protein
MAETVHINKFLVNNAKNFLKTGNRQTFYVELHQGTQPVLTELSLNDSDLAGARVIRTGQTGGLTHAELGVAEMIQNGIAIQR